MNLSIGIDWSSQKHDAVILNEYGATIAAVSFPHTVDGFAYFDDVRRQTGVAAAECAVGMETHYSLLIDFLHDRAYGTVYVVPPRIVKNRRREASASSAHTDQTDAQLIATLVRQEPHLLQVWRPEGLLISQLRATVSERLFLVTESLRLGNRLASLLGRYYPAARIVFSDPLSQIALHFVQTYPTPQAATTLSYEQFVAFAKEHGYRRTSTLPRAYARLQTPQPVARPAAVAALWADAQQLAQLLLVLTQAKLATQKRLAALFAAHPDHELFASLPAVGETLAPSLLAKFGDDRERFPTAASVQALAGTCPVTMQSGKMRQVVFRHACDHEFRTIAQQWARIASQEMPWAAAYLGRHMQPQRTASQAYRRLANRLLNIAWTVWQTKTPYDEQRHMQDCAKRSRPKAA